MNRLTYRAIVTWSFAAAYSVAYHLLMVVVRTLKTRSLLPLIRQEAAVCSVYVMLHQAGAGNVSNYVDAVKTVGRNSRCVKYD